MFCFSFFFHFLLSCLLHSLSLSLSPSRCHSHPLSFIPRLGVFVSLSIASSHSVCFSLPTPPLSHPLPQTTLLLLSCLSSPSLSLSLYLTPSLSLPLSLSHSLSCSLSCSLSLFKSSLILSSYSWTAVITFMTQILLLTAKYFVCVRDRVCVCVCVRACMHAHHPMCLCVLVYIYICIFVHMCVCVCCSFPDNPSPTSLSYLYYCLFHPMTRPSANRHVWTQRSQSVYKLCVCLLCLTS